MSIELLHAAFEHVRACGEGFRADCPNPHRSKGNLAYKELQDGTILLKCHSGCSVPEVLQPVNLQMSDLFPKRLDKPIDVRQAREWKKRAEWKAAFEFLPPEIRVVEMASDITETALKQMGQDGPLNAADRQTFEVACERIRTAARTLK